MEGYYNQLKSRNVIRLLRNMLKAGALELRGSDGKFVANLKIQWDTPWVHVKNSYETNCFWWKDVTFHEIVEKQLPASHWFVPMGCQECFKVVVKPKTIAGLFALEEIETQLDLPSKCGIELRPSVFGNYGGYFYNRGLEQGLKCYQTVREVVSDHPRLGPGVTVLLKRGCTELEHSVGPSDQWVFKDFQIPFETRLSQLFVNDVPVLRQPDHLKDHVRQTWIERAYDVGDDTVFEFTGGRPLYPDYITYHHFCEEADYGK